MIVKIAGIDLSTLGVLEAEIPALDDGLDYDHQLLHVPGRDGRVRAGVDSPSREKRIEIVGAVSWQTHASVLAALDELKWRIEDREVPITVVDRLTRELTGTSESMRYPPIRPQVAQRMLHFRWTFLAPEPLWYETTETVVNFLAGAAQAPLGSARARPVITIVGPVTNPRVTYRDSAGVIRGEMLLNVVLAAGATLVVDTDARTITTDGKDAHGILDDSTEFLVLDHRHYAAVGGPYPTLAISPSGAVSAVARYKRTWR